MYTYNESWLCRFDESVETFPQETVPCAANEIASERRV